MTDTGRTPDCPIDHTSFQTDNYRPFAHEGAFEFFQAARAKAPVFYNEEIGYWVVTKRDLILDIMRDPTRFSAQNTLSPVKAFPDELNAYLQARAFSIEPTQVNCDPPKHTRIRTAVSKYLNIKTFHALEPEIRKIARVYIDKLKGRKQVDLVEALTYEFPAHVLFLLLGLPEEDTYLIKKWGDNRLYLTFGKLADEDMEDGVKSLLSFWQYCRRLVAECMDTPGNDYPSALLEIRNGDDAVLSVNEIVCLVFGLLLAGHETTTNASSNVILELLQGDAEDWRKLQADPSLIPNAVEEGLRYASSVVAWRRVALEDVTIGGVDIPAGANLLVALGSANRDEDHIEAGEVFDIERENARGKHISFGHGIHFCIGAPLARLEMKVLLEELTQAFPDMRLVEDQTIDWVETIAFRGPKRLRVQLR